MANYLRKARVRAGLPDLAPTTTLVISRWNYLGSGYGASAALLAAHVWHPKELERPVRGRGDC